ncbi:MAG TPA: sensor histidine kinase [Actinomycetes bacterium]|nr:sensor histidine kinase [Actinomycetes bacterium]
MKERTGGSWRLPSSAWLFDIALALVAAGLGTALFVSEPMLSGLPRGTLALGYGLMLLHTVPLAARRRFPGAVLGISVASGLAFAAVSLPPVFLGPAILVAVYSVAAYGSRWVSLAGLAAAEVGLAAVQLTPGRTGVDTLVSNVGVLAAAWLLGRFVGVRRVYVGQLEERTAELEQAREELARRAVAEERLRLARELHDVVAHSMSVIAVQSGVGAHVADTRPEEAAKALAAIEATSRAALTELRRLLGVLRRDSEPHDDLTPVPGLADLEILLAEVAKAGLAVRVRVEGTQSQLPAGVDLSAYRIVQEALTNVVKHAGPARAEVVVGYGDQEVTVEVTDDGRGVMAVASDGRVGSGHGLIGMRERVAAFGGDLEVGPRPGGGFRVAARLPLAADGR